MSGEEQTNDVMSWCSMDCCGPVGMEDTDMQEWMDLCGQMMDKCMSYNVDRQIVTLLRYRD